MISVIDKFCLKGYCLSSPNIPFLIVPLAVLIGVLLALTFIRFKAKEEKKSYVKSHLLDRILFGALRILALLSLLIALATPSMIKETVTQGTPQVTILADNSTSFSLFDTSLAERLQKGLQQYFPVSIRSIAQGERSPIADGILQGMRGNDQLLVVSDGQNNFGRDLSELLLVTSTLNSTIHSVNLRPMKKDAGIAVEGPHQVIAKSEAPFQVRISNVGNVPYSMEVFVDGDQVYPNAEGKFTWRFSLGFHKIMARIRPSGDDFFPQNNIFYKTVKAIPRPKVAFVSELSSPLGEALQGTYDVSIMGDIPEQPALYDAVVLNNINANKLTNGKVDTLAGYLGDSGKGLVVIGGDSAFDKGAYKNHYFESILPAQVGVAKKQPGGEINVVVVIDISESTGFGFSQGSGSTKIDVEKSLASNILNQLSQEYKVAVVAFNHRGFVLSQLAPLSEQYNLSRRIASLKDTGGTLVSAGLQKASALLLKAGGSKNVIVISDGITQMPGDAIAKAKELASQGAKVFSVGVGENTDETFMKLLAANGGGLYFRPSEAQRLSLVLGDTPDGKEESMSLLVVDSSHWITKGDFSLNAKLSGYNFILPKSQGRKLITTDIDRPIVVAGRFGLGRIVAIATDDGSKWAGQLLRKENSKFFTKAINWAVGDFTKDIANDLRVEDTSLGKSSQVFVLADKAPEVKGLEFAKVDAGLYSASFRPVEEGFFSILGGSVAVSYADEYQRLGFNQELEELVTLSGGYMFDPNDVEAMKTALFSLAKRVKMEVVNLRFPFIIIALLLVLADILIRRIRENTGRA